MKQVTVIGADTILGHEVTSQLLLKGFKVLAYGRNVHTKKWNGDLQPDLMAATVLDNESLQKACASAQYIIVAIQGSSEATDRSRSLAISTILKHCAPARIVVHGHAGILKTAGEKMLSETNDFINDQPHLSDEATDIYAMLKASAFTWTMVVSMGLQNGKPDGHFLLTDHFTESVQLEPSTGNLAMALINAAADEYELQVLALKNIN